MRHLLLTVAVLGLSAFSASAQQYISKRPDGMRIGQTADQLFSFHGVTPVAQRAAAAQAALTNSTGGSTANATLAAGALTDSTTGSASGTLAAATNTSALTDNTTGSATTTLASISDAATKNAIASLAAQLAIQRSLNTVLINAVASLAAKSNTHNDNVAKISVLLNELRAAEVEKGLIKGAP